MKSKAVRRQEALERQAKYDSFTLVQKVVLVHSRPGRSEREMIRLRKSLFARTLNELNEEKGE